MFINDAVCEGCGDCSTKSNCVSLLPQETPHGRKRRIDQSACNEDLSCVNGFCPSFVVLRGARVRGRALRTATAREMELPDPPRAHLDQEFNVMITGIGGTGVITIGAVLAMAARLEGKGASTYNMTGLAQKYGPVYSHMRFSPAPRTDTGFRIDVADADVIVACDVLAALAPECLSTAAHERTRIAMNTSVEPTALFQSFRDSPLPGARQCEQLAKAVGTDNVATIDATSLAVRELGDRIAANMVMVGFALQKGLLPLGAESIERAIKLNDVAVEENLRALRLGREAAVSSERDRASPTQQQPVTQVSLEGEIELGRQLLTAYRNGGLAARYEVRVRAMASLEVERGAGGNELAIAVARQYRKLLAYKDEYEVARLYAEPAFRVALSNAFEEYGAVSVLLAPPILGGAPGPDGNPRKREFGAWVFPMFRALAALKGLRGTRLDPFGWTAERRTERRLIEEYEEWLDAIARHYRADNRDAAVRLAGLPDGIRGFGVVKMRSVDTARKTAAALLEALRKPASAREITEVA